MEDLPNGLRHLNSLQPHEVEGEFLKCCGSKNWAREMSCHVPFRNLSDLLETARAVWWGLSVEDWLEAFRSHPKIGAQKPAAPVSSESLSWSSKEQAGVAKASAAMKDTLAELNRRYEEKFGFIYIVCATGKSFAELLALLQERLGHDVETELQIAGGEQAKITELRLNKLLESFDEQRQKT